MSDDTGNIDRPDTSPEMPPDPAPAPPIVGTPPSPPSAPLASPSRSVGRLVALGVLVIVLIGTIGAAGYFVSKLGGSGEELIHRVPQDARVFATFYLDPSAAQKINLERVLRRFPSLPGQGDPTAVLAASIDEALSGEGMTYEADVKPWIGPQIGVAGIQEGDAGEIRQVILIASRDDGAAQAFIDGTTRSSGGSESTTQYGGVTITDTGTDGAFAVSDGVVIAGEDPDDLHAVIDTMAGDAPSLAENSSYTRTMVDLPEDRLAMVWVDIQAAFTDLADETSADVPGVPESGTDVDAAMAQLEAFEGLGATLTAEPDGISLQLAIPMDPEMLTPEQQQMASAAHENASIGWTPEEALALITINGFADQLNSALGTAVAGIPAGAGSSSMADMLGIEDLLDAASGDAGLQVTPATGGFPLPTGTIMLATDDTDAMQAALDETIPTLVAGESSFGEPEPLPPRTTTTSYRGVQITAVEQLTRELNPVVPAWAVTGGMAIIGSNADAVKQAIDAHADDATIASNPTFTAALSHGNLKNSSMMYLDVATIATTISGFGGDLGPGAEVLHQLRAVVYTQTTTEDGMAAEIFALLTDDGDAKAS